MLSGLEAFLLIFKLRVKSKSLTVLLGGQLLSHLFYVTHLLFPVFIWGLHQLSQLHFLADSYLFKSVGFINAYKTTAIEC